jgi:hypothetical protein
MSTDFFNKNDNAIEKQIGMPLEKYSFADLKFDTGDINLNFNMKIIEDIMKQEYVTVKYTNRSTVYTDIGYVPEAMENITWYPTLDQTIDILGLDTLENKFGFDVSTIIGAVKSRRPGTGSPLHIDKYRTTNKEGKHVQFPTGVSSKINRWVVHLQDWNWGEFCQCDNRIMAGWRAGDAYQIPKGIPHLAVNYGIRNRNFLSVTGTLKD